MGVYIKGMKMPISCAMCPLCHRSFDGNETKLACYGIKKWCDENMDRLNDCPLVEVPEPHGDLIDRQKLLEDNKHVEYPANGKYRKDRAWAVGFNSGAIHCNEHAVHAKPVIEAEGE